MRTQHGILAALAIGLALSGGGPASAQSTRTFVSGVGNDANTCSRVSPCRTFAGAITKTAAAGEINCLDTGSYGPVTITKSLSIVCDKVTASVLGSGVDGITVSAAATDEVFISGLDIHGTGSSAGINVTQVGELRVARTAIRGFTNGIVFAPTNVGSLFVGDSDFSGNGSVFFGNGISVGPPAGGGANVHIERTRLKHNANGLRVIGSASTAGINVSMRDSVVAGSFTAGVEAGSSAGKSPVTVSITGTMISGNATGIKADSPASTGLGSAIVRVGSSTITAGGTGINRLNLAQVLSHGNNKLIGNTAGEAFSGLVALK